MKRGIFRMRLQLFERPSQRILIIARRRPGFDFSFQERRQMFGSSDFGLDQGQCRRNQLKTRSLQDKSYIGCRDRNRR